MSLINNIRDDTSDGGPAFPSDYRTQLGGAAHPGMSLRDYFAVAALQGCLANPEIIRNNIDTEVPSGKAMLSNVKWAYLVADAMLAEREK